MSAHLFDPAIAAQVGLNAAVIYQNLKFWCDKNAANGRHLHDGEYWSYNSVKAFDVLFPYLSKSQIRTAMDKLENTGLIKVGNFNASTYDRTKWFCVPSQIHLSEIANGIVKNHEPIPDSKPDNKPDDKPDAQARDNSKILEILGSVMSEDTAQAYVDHRKAKRSKVTEHAASLIAKKLAGNPNADDIVNESILNGWTGIFPERNQEGTKQHAGSKQDGAAIDRAQRVANRYEERQRIKSQKRLDIGQDRDTSKPLFSTG